MWGWQTRVCLRVCTKMMCDESPGRADGWTCARVFVQHTSGRVRNWVGVGEYSKRSRSSDSLVRAGGCGERSRLIYALLGAEAAFAE